VITATKHPPRSGPAHSRLQSIYQRGGQSSQWRQSIRQGSTDVQSSVREEDTPYDKASIEGSGHDTLSSKASTKEEAIDKDGKESTKGESDSGKASATMTPARSSVVGLTIAVEHRHTQAQLGTSPRVGCTVGNTDVDNDTGSKRVAVSDSSTTPLGRG
jgi:hypothetical protein